MIRLKAHSKTESKFSKIDKFLLVPKRNWDDFVVGEGEYSVNSEKFSLRVYDVPCDCNQKMHTHRIVDLGPAWEKLGLSEGAEVEIER